MRKNYNNDRDENYDGDDEGYDGDDDQSYFDFIHFILSISGPFY